MPPGQCDAVAAAVAETWPEAKSRDEYPLEGSSYRVYMSIPDRQGGREMEVALDESGEMISLEYGSPEQSAEFVAWLAQRFPPPDDAEVHLYKWGDNPRVTARTTVEDLLAAGP